MFQRVRDSLIQSGEFLEGIRTPLSSLKYFSKGHKPSDLVYGFFGEIRTPVSSLKYFQRVRDSLGNF